MPATPFRRYLIVLALVLGSATLVSPAGAADDADDLPDEISSLVVDRTVLVTAGTQDSMTTSPSPRPGRGPAVRCGWFGFSADSIDSIDIFQVLEPVIDRSYILWCWYVENLQDLPGHPIVTVFTGRGLPGIVADVDTVSEFALSEMDFVRPVPELNPASLQIVGVESWLAVTSRLTYDPIHANAGPVWISVRPEFRDVSWNLGNGDIVVCTNDATRVWDPHRDSQSSDCTYTYETSGDSDGIHEVFATVTWTILRRTFQQPQWQPWRDYSLTTTETIQVTELQAAIY